MISNEGDDSKGKNESIGRKIILLPMCASANTHEVVQTSIHKKKMMVSNKKTVAVTIFTLLPSLPRVYLLDCI